MLTSLNLLGPAQHLINKFPRCFLHPRKKISNNLSVNLLARSRNYISPQVSHFEMALALLRAARGSAGALATLRVAAVSSTAKSASPAARLFAAEANAEAPKKVCPYQRWVQPNCHVPTSSSKTLDTRRDALVTGVCLRYRCMPLCQTPQW